MNSVEKQVDSTQITKPEGTSARADSSDAKMDDAESSMTSTATALATIPNVPSVGGEGNLSGYLHLHRELRR